MMGEGEWQDGQHELAAVQWRECRRMVRVISDVLEDGGDGIDLVYLGEKVRTLHMRAGELAGTFERILELVEEETGEHQRGVEAGPLRARVLDELSAGGMGR
jgi:hypothetical protein